jgi:quinol monooxygenase YgiN
MVIRFTATPEGTEPFAELLEQALALVEPEPGTTPWMALRDSEKPNTFFVVDLYADAAARERHVTGPAAALVLGEGRKHLVADPEIAEVGLLAGKHVDLTAAA